jgi:hypothetical protein
MELVNIGGRIKMINLPTRYLCCCFLSSGNITRGKKIEQDEVCEVCRISGRNEKCTSGFKE